MAYNVAQRRHELGVRMALGANARAVFSLILRDGLKLTAAGLALGMVGALLTSRLIASMLYTVSATDVATYLGVTVVLVAVAVLASFLPARRATRVDPADRRYASTDIGVRRGRGNRPARVSFLGRRRA